MSAQWTRQLRWPEIEARRMRLERTTDANTMRGMFFASTFELVKRLIDQSAADEVRRTAALAESEYSQLKKYPLADFIKLQTVAAQRIQHITGSFEEGVAKVAAGAVEIFFESVAGRTMKLLAGKEPHRLMSAAPNGYALAVSDGATRDYKKTGERSGEFVFENDLLGPCHQMGTFEYAIREACGIQIEAKVEQTEAWNFKFIVSW